MLRSMTTTAALALLAGSAAADGISYAYLSYDYQDFSTDALANPTVTLFQGQVEYELNQFVLGADINNTAIDSDIGTGDFQEYGFSGAYRVSPQILAGLGMQFFSEGDVDETTYEIFGQYVADPFGAAINYTFDDDDNSITGLFGQYAVNAGIDVGAVIFTNSVDDGFDYHISGDYAQGAIDGRVFLAGNSEVDGQTFGVRGNYAFGEAFRATASYETTLGGDFTDTALRIGGGYEVTEGVWLDASYGQLDLEDIDTVDVLRALITFEMGDRARLDNEMTQDIVEDAWFGVAPIFIFTPI